MRHNPKRGSKIKIPVNNYSLLSTDIRHFNHYNPSNHFIFTSKTLHHYKTLTSSSKYPISYIHSKNFLPSSLFHWILQNPFLKPSDSQFHFLTITPTMRISHLVHRFRGNKYHDLHHILFHFIYQNHLHPLPLSTLLLNPHH